MKEAKQYLEDIQYELEKLHRKTTYCVQYYDDFLNEMVQSWRMASDIKTIRSIIDGLINEVKDDLSQLDEQEESENE